MSRVDPANVGKYTGSTRLRVDVATSANRREKAPLCGGARRSVYVHARPAYCAAAAARNRCRPLLNSMEPAAGRAPRSRVDPPARERKAPRQGTEGRGSIRPGHLLSITVDERSCQPQFSDCEVSGPFIAPGPAFAEPRFRQYRSRGFGAVRCDPPTRYWAAGNPSLSGRKRLGSRCVQWSFHRGSVMEDRRLS